jgi:predicted RNA-binding Zn ribbon-like protein
MATAAFKLNTLSQERIDADASVIYGVRLCEVGKVARFNGPDGKPREAEITAEHADAFLAHAGNRAIPVHWTHDYLSDDKDRLHAKVGALKNFRKDELGNPIADFYVAPSEYKDAILWNAKEDPENMMLSAVFSYDPKDPKALPMDFQAADLVECGAATTALFSETTTHTQAPMFTDEQKAELSEMISSGIKTALAEANKPEDKTAELADADAAEKEAGVTDADKKPEDEKKPAAMRAALRIARATERKALAALKEYEKNDVAAQAKFTAMLGRSGAFTPATGVQAAKLSRAKFKALPIDERNKFMRDGGKLED